MTDSRCVAPRGSRTARMRPLPSRSVATIGCSMRGTCDPARAELARDGVDEEREVVGVGLEHRADRLVAVLARASG